MNKLNILKVKREKIGKRYRIFYYCQCSCGNKKWILKDSVDYGKTSSCGCLRKEKNTKRISTHKKSGARIYKIWVGMKMRCYNKNLKGYKHYGGRGIRVCSRWKSSFENFYNDMINSYKENLTIERIDVNGNYSPQNCKWATKKEQARNKRSSVYITYKGKKKLALDWSEEIGINYETLKRRIKTGWLVEKAFNTPTKSFWTEEFLLKKLGKFISWYKQKHGKVSNSGEMFKYPCDPDKSERVIKMFIEWIREEVK